MNGSRINYTNNSQSYGGFNPDSCDGDHDVKPTMILYLIFIALIMVCSVVGNLFVVSAVFLSNTLKRRITFYFIASLGE